MKQRHFSFIHSYLNFANVAWASTSKSNLISLHCHQNHVIRIIYNLFALTKPLFKHPKTLKVFQILSLIFKYKKRTAPFVFHNFYFRKPSSKYSLRTDNLLSTYLKRTKVSSQSSISYRGLYLQNKIITRESSIREYYPLFKNKFKKSYFFL